MNRSLKALVAGAVLAAAGLVTSTHAVAAPDPTPTTVVVAVDVRCYPDGPTYSKWSVFWLVDGDPNATITSETETFGNTQGVGKPVPWSLFATYSQGTTHVSMAATTSNGQSASLTAGEPAECRIKPAPSKPAPPAPRKPAPVTHAPVKATGVPPVAVQAPVVPQVASQSAAPVLVDQSAPPASRPAKTAPAPVEPTTMSPDPITPATTTAPVAAVPFTATSTAGSDFPYVAALIIGLALLLVGAGVLFGVRHTR